MMGDVEYHPPVKIPMPDILLSQATSKFDGTTR